MATSIPQPGSAFKSPQDIVERVAQRADQTAHRAVDKVEEVRQKAEQSMASQQAQLSHRIREWGSAIRTGGEQLSDDESVSQLLERAGRSIDRVASYVDGASARGVANDLTRLSHEKPVWFYGGAFLAGLALGRLARASAEAEARGELPRGVARTEEDQAPYPTTYPTTMARP
jgi:hypothetical protein